MPCLIEAGHFKSSYSESIASKLKIKLLAKTLIGNLGSRFVHLVQVNL